jgi:hypothetical protein
MRARRLGTAPFTAHPPTGSEGAKLSIVGLLRQAMPSKIPRRQTWIFYLEA